MLRQCRALIIINCQINLIMFKFTIYKKVLYRLLGCVAIFIASFGSYAQSFTYSEGNGIAVDVSNTDLLQAFGSVSASSGNFNQEGTAGINTLTNGNANTANSDLAQIGDNSSITYSLDVSTNYEGYNIDEISIYTSWQDNGRIRPNVSVYYALASNPAAYIFLTTANYSSITVAGANPYVKSNYLVSGGTLTGVAKLRFDFGNQEGGVGYSEIDISGSTVPILVAINPLSISFDVNGSSSVVSITSPINLAIANPSNINSSSLSVSSAAGTSLITFTAAAFLGNQAISGDISLSGNNFYKAIAYTYDVQFASTLSMLTFSGNGGTMFNTITSNVAMVLSDNGGLIVSPSSIGVGSTVLTVTAPVNYRFFVKTGAITFSVGSTSRQINYSIDKTTNGIASDILVYEPFDYALGNLNLPTFNGGVGLSSNWILGVNGNGNSSNADFRIKNSPVFEYSGLASVSNYITGGNNQDAGTNIGRPIDLNYGSIPSYLDANNVIGKPGETLYLSFVMSKTAQWRDHENTVTLYNGTDPSNGSGKRLVEFGYFNNVASVNGGPYPVGIRTGGSSTNSGSEFSINQDTPSLMVLKIQFGATQHTFTGFVNPTVGNSEPAPMVGPSVYTFDANTSGFSQIAFSLGNDNCCYGENGANQGSGVFDELRLGKTYASVVPARIILPLTGLNITGTKTINTPAGTTQLSADIIPGNALQSLVVSWSSSNTTKASVSPSGLVTGVTNGVVTITATATNPLNATVSGMLVLTVSGQLDQVYLSTLDWVSATTGFSTVKKDKSVRNNPLILGGITYQKGIGIHANGEIIYNLNGAFEKFTSQIGVDDESTAQGSVKFQVFGDGNLLYESAVIFRADPSVFIEVPLLGVNELKLVVDQANGSNDNDHAIWADAKLFVLIPITSVTINSPSTTIAGNSTQMLSFTGSSLPSNANQNLTWAVESDPKVSAFIDSVSGVLMVSTNEVGMVTVTGTAFYPTTVKNSVIVSVKAVPISATGISINGAANGKVNINQTVVLNEVYTPIGQVNQLGVTWSSSDPSIASVANGTVSGLALGTVTITAIYALDNSIKATKVIKVVVPVTSVSVSGVSSLMVGGTTTLVGMVAPANPSDPALTWSSSNTSRATVNAATGAVSAISIGIVTITATSVDGPSGSVELTISPILVSSITISGNSQIAKGASSQLSASILPANATTKTLTWTTSNSNIATVTGSGLVRGLNLGVVTITATSVSTPSILASYEISVLPINVTLVGIANVSVAKRTLTVGGVLTVTAIVLPAAATNKAVVWSSSNEAIASVTSSTGVITALSAGVFTITASSVGSLTVSAMIVLTVTDTQLSTTSELASAIGLYPNPTEDMLYIVADGSVNILTVSIINISGSEVYTQSGIAAISVGALPKGMYAVKIVSDKGVVINKILVE